MKKTFIERTKGFTLIELLVTLGVFLILSTLIVSGMTNTFNKGKDVHCLSNLRQLGVALNLYLADSGGELPLEGNEENPTWAQVSSDKNRKAWFNVLPPYVEQKALSELAGSATERQNFSTGKTSSILQCPRAIWQGNEAKASGPRFSYAFNSKIGQCRVIQITSGHGSNAGNRVVGASTVPMLLDTRASMKEPKAMAGMNDDVGTAKAYTRRLSNRHGNPYTPEGTAHMVFLDGSVRSYQVGDIMNSKGRNIATSPVIWNPWDPDEE